jgi:hypothetical protein
MSMKEDLDGIVDDTADRGKKLMETLDKEIMSGLAYKAALGFVREMNQNAYQMRLIAVNLRDD